MKVRDVMRKKFISFRADDKLDYVLEVLAQKKVNSAPVLDGGEFLGIVCVCNMVKYFTSKEFAGMWSSKKDLNTAGLKKIIAADLVKGSSHKIKLNPEDDLVKVLSKIGGKADCIPVIGQDGKLVGIVRNEDLINLFSKQIMLCDQIGGTKKESGAKASKKEMITELDSLLEIVNEEGEISSGALAKRMGISKKRIEEMAECLGRHNLIVLRYSFLGGAILRSVDHA